MDARAFAAELAQPGTLYLMHANADPDCAAAAAALQRAFGGHLAAPAGVNPDARRLLERLGMEVDPMPHPRKFARTVAVDTSSAAQIKHTHREAERLLLVDHHAYGDLVDVADAAWRDPDRSSCCEVVLDLLDAAGVAPDADVAFALACGVITDTDRFRYANARTYEAMARLLPLAGEPMGVLLDFLRKETGDDAAARDRSRRLARLKAAERARVEHVGPWIVALSHVGAHDGAAAAGLLHLGADVALVLRERSRTARVSARAHPRAVQHGIHLGEILHAVARDHDWSGGGHAGSAGMNGTPPAAPLAEAALDRVRRILEGGGA